MKIRYEFVTGTVEVEVSAEMAALHMELDRIEYNNNHKETRRHTTLDNGFDEKEWLASDEYNPINIIEADAEARRIRQVLQNLQKRRGILYQRCSLRECPAGNMQSPSVFLLPLYRSS